MVIDYHHVGNPDWSISSSTFFSNTVHVILFSTSLTGVFLLLLLYFETHVALYRYSLKFKNEFRIGEN